LKIVGDSDVRSIDACRHPLRPELDGARDLLQRLHRREPDLAAAARDAATLRIAELRVDLGEVLFDHELDPIAHRAFLAGLGQEDDVPVERDVLPLQDQHGHERRGDVVLVVHRAAPVDVAPLADRAEGGVGPLLRVDVDRVGVPHDQQRPFAAVPLQPRHHVRPVRFDGEHLDGDALALENVLQVVGGGLLVPRRIGGVEADERLEVAHRLLLERRPVEGGLGRR
jgi:hypothetical protein